MALEKDTLGLFINPSSAREVLQDELPSIKDPNLQELPLDSLYIVQEYHALIVLRLRICSLTEIFTVIIKGTQVYSPEKGRWIELNPQDVHKMFGRAGRPQYDTFGEGIIIISHTELQYYLSLAESTITN